MSHKQLKFCLACYLAAFSALQFISILYLTGWIPLENLQKLVRPCQSTYYFSKLTYFENSYEFADENSCERNVKSKFTCIFSDKKIDSFYSQSHNLDAVSAGYLDSLQEHKTYHTNNIVEFSKFSSIQNLIDVAQNKIQFISFKKKGKSIYIITSFLPKKSCNALALDVLEDL